MNLPEREYLEKLVILGNRFRETLIVDNDFPRNRDAFDLALKEATQFLSKNKPPIIWTERMIHDGCMGEQEILTTIFRRPT